MAKKILLGMLVVLGAITIASAGYKVGRYLADLDRSNQVEQSTGST